MIKKKNNTEANNHTGRRNKNNAHRMIKIGKHFITQSFKKPIKKIKYDRSERKNVN